MNAEQPRDFRCRLLTTPASTRARTLPACLDLVTPSPSVDFTIATPQMFTAFKTRTEFIMATYGESNVIAGFRLKSSVVAGILNSLSVFPTTVAGGMISTGTITLVEAVPVKTIVGLAALDSGVGSFFPHPGMSSSFASVPSSITLEAGQTTATFPITASGDIFPGTGHSARIMANAIVTKWVTLTVTG